MNYYIILLLSIVLIAGISSPVNGQTMSENVVINEVDTNPPGDDSLSISEWVELYNPTDSDVDISGWQIASTTVLKKTLTIPENTILTSGGFLTFVHEKVWFTDTAESVELKNENGLLIDKTREIFDLQNDSNTWQRIYDGFSDWKFESTTAGASNGKFVEMPGSSSTVLVTVESDKPSYFFDETLLIQGTVSEKIFTEKPYFQTEPIMINISGPNFVHTLSLYPDYDLKYDATLKLSSVLGINQGIYDVSVSYAGVSATTNFSVEFETVDGVSDSSSSLTLETNESEYFPGQIVSINGFTSEIIPFESIKFIIEDSTGQLIADGNLFTSDGTFTTTTFLNPLNLHYGVYTVTIEYAEQTESTSFNVVEYIEQIESVDSPSLIFNLDQSEYSINDPMTLSGSILNFDSSAHIYYEVVYLTFTDSDGQSPTTKLDVDSSGAGYSVDNIQLVDYTLTAIPDENGIFSISSRIIPVVFLEGDYTVKANYGGLIESENFSVVNINASADDTASADDSFVMKTILEKVNRIPDSLISINTQGKIINEQSVKPRVLSGSMIVMDKDSRSKVNLQITSESGVCIIGPDTDCLVSESTRKPGQIFDVVEVDGLNFNVRYSGPDVRLEKFSILPQLSSEFLPDTNWNVEVLKDDEVSRFYYKITLKSFQ